MAKNSTGRDRPSTELSDFKLQVRTYRESEKPTYIERTRNDGTPTAADKANIKLLLAQRLLRGRKGGRSYEVIGVDRKSNTMRLHVEVDAPKGSGRQARHLFFLITVKGVDLGEMWYVKHPHKGFKVT